MTDLDLLRRYEPIIRFTEGELFLPVAVEDYVAACALMERTPGERNEMVVAERGTLTLEGLSEIGATRSGPGLFLRLVDDPFSRAETARWSLRSARPRFHGANRLTRVGILSRVIDALLRISLIFRGKVASGAEAAAETICRDQIRQNHHPYYARVVREGGYVVLQYWFFYAFNDWRSRVSGVNDHEADWEQVVVYLAEQSDETMTPEWVVYSAHDEVGDDLRRRWDDPDLTLVDDHPVVFAGIGSHSGSYLKGEYLTTFEPPAFLGLLRMFRSVTHVILPWTRSNKQAGIGVPYIDYARGDGAKIGPGQDQEWAPVIIGDETPWVLNYRGLWGNDTADPLAGERGPGGPRYERSGVVRKPWGDVVGWSGLAKVAPNPQIAAELIRQRLEELDDELDAANGELSAHRMKLRADTASGVSVSRTEEEALENIAARNVALEDERRQLKDRLDTPPLLAGPHEHLRHRHVPLKTESRSRRRVLSIWSALSTPLILLLIASTLRQGATAPLRGVLVGAMFVLLTFEAIARRQLVRFLATVVAIAAAAVVASAIIGLVLIEGWRIVTVVCIAVVAVAIAATNLRELARD